ncbi:cupin domain-containing protein [Burkholderia cenocepacia]|uniref:cupin domain-containing protein n=1 Tax=Burkholderia cenocepacia TaxID=95486 RepID=UPI0022373B45|nr:cupin domain-containing protein [Burkholderia cenocepacia]MCW5115766.1 cupin domain-containing protein [Burkholderia cenocepacia]MCW5131966.1 cupin domain-containing protein [Burkholderia cenocepacia]MCW5176060.1 cupin domain-containing protein [Burkholderia cenocepacia]
MQMKSIHKYLAAATAVFALAAPFATATHAAERAKAAPQPLVSFPVSDLKWRELPGTGGIKVADLRGSITGHGPYDAFVIFPAGKDNPYHLHTQNLPTVVLKGTFYAIIDGKRTEYPAGSFYNLPADMPHYSGCEKGEDCLLFQYQADHFDLVPVAKK